MPDRPRGPEQWDPSYPEFASQGEDKTVYPDAQTGGMEYQPAPESSHVYGFKFLTGGFVRKFYAGTDGVPAGTAAVLGVAFKPAPPKGSDVHPNTIKSEYEYYFADEGAGRAYYDRMRAAAHPGEVVHELIRDRVAYRKIVAR